MGSIAENIRRLLEGLSPGVVVVAVTKTRTPGEAMEAYNAGLRIFGENRVQELVSKREQLPGDISWHLIGHLQSNKVKQAVASAAMIESVDTVRLLRLIDAEALGQGKSIDCLLQVHIASEESKSGFSIAEMMATDWGEVESSLKAARICGVMGMATFTDDTERVRSEFRTLADLYRQLRERYFSHDSHFREISMGMTGDWQMAVEEGSTMIRVGTLIFGERLKK
ncbi:MAG: YggS family pyridoxal phosphate-dependent enzyme [Bacteroidales bacterium]|jgi:pyridoxal phosphate enzyme (YggS family)|nr:YggS family pyridoxal phosphate-dependent enzyme [Bacteroidales bacterium]